MLDKGPDLQGFDRITSYNVCYTKLLRGVGVWGCIVVIGRAAAEHFGLEFIKLDVDFKPDPYSVRVFVDHLRHLRRSLRVIIGILLKSIGCTQDSRFVKGFAHYLEPHRQSVSKAAGYGN